MDNIPVERTAMYGGIEEETIALDGEYEEILAWDYPDDDGSHGDCKQEAAKICTLLVDDIIEQAWCTVLQKHMMSLESPLHIGHARTRPLSAERSHRKSIRPHGRSRRALSRPYTVDAPDETLCIDGYSIGPDHGGRFGMNKRNGTARGATRERWRPPPHQQRRNAHADRSRIHQPIGALQGRKMVHTARERTNSMSSKGWQRSGTFESSSKQDVSTRGRTRFPALVISSTSSKSETSRHVNSSSTTASLKGAPPITNQQ